MMKKKEDQEKQKQCLCKIFGSLEGFHGIGESLVLLRDFEDLYLTLLIPFACYHLICLLKLQGN